jgi:hypothetical protein
MEMPTFSCSLCNKECQGWGNNPAPLITSVNARCCEKCNAVVVFCRMNLKGNQRLNRRLWISRVANDDPALQPIYQMFGY